MLEFSVLLQVALRDPMVWEMKPLLCGKKKNPCFKLMGKTDAHKLSKS